LQPSFWPVSILPCSHPTVFPSFHLLFNCPSFYLSTFLNPTIHLSIFVQISVMTALLIIHHFDLLWFLGNAVRYCLGCFMRGGGRRNLGMRS
jgi:hypothetical protein